MVGLTNPDDKLREPSNPLPRACVSLRALRFVCVAFPCVLCVRFPRHVSLVTLPPCVRCVAAVRCVRALRCVRFPCACVACGKGE